jgi:hypothetical protein
MFCPRCGTQNAEDARFCRQCAQAFTSTSARPNPATAAPNPGPALNDLPYPGYQGRQNPSFQNQHPPNPPAPVYANQPPSFASGGYQQSEGASGRAIASLVLVLVAFFVGCGPFLSIPALILGKQEMDAIRLGQAPRAGELMAKFGFYGGIAVTLLYCGGGLLVGLLMS